MTILMSVTRRQRRQGDQQWEELTEQRWEMTKVTGSRQMREDLAGPVWTSLFEE